MSWSILVMPLHVLAADGGLEWAASASFSYGVPDQVPAPRRLPLATEVLQAFRSSGCHGTPWFRVEDLDTAAWLPECSNPAECRGTASLDLGEVNLGTVDKREPDEPIPQDALIDSVSFRKPNPAAALQAVSALTNVAGPQVVTDTVDCDTVFVVWPDDDPDELAQHWPW